MGRSGNEAGRLSYEYHSPLSPAGILARGRDSPSLGGIATHGRLRYPNKQLLKFVDVLLLFVEVYRSTCAVLLKFNFETLWCIRNLPDA